MPKHCKEGVKGVWILLGGEASKQASKQAVKDLAVSGRASRSLKLVERVYGWG